MSEEGATPATPATPAPKPFGRQVLDLLARSQTEPTGLVGAGVVLVVCAVASLIGWIPLSWPAQAIDRLLPNYYTWCGGTLGFATGSPQMYVCSAAVGLLAAAFAALAARLPSESRFLVGPIAGTLAFTVAWAGTHYTAEAVGSFGLVPHPVFPAVVGLFLYAVARWGARLQSLLGPLLALRDRYPIGYRVIAAIAVPLLFSLFMGNATNPEAARKAQVVAVVALLAGYVALMPRTGPPLSGIERTLREMGAP